MTYINIENYSIFDRIARFFSPTFRNQQDLKVATLVLEKLQSASEMEATLKDGETLSGRISKMWLVSKDLKKVVGKINLYLRADRVAKKQGVPIEKLVKHPKMINVILANHLHNKITEQHRREGLGITFSPTSVPMISAFGRKMTYEEIKEYFGSNFDEKSGKIKESEYLSDGLESHHSKKWNKLRPLYPMTERNGNYVHFDPSTNREEVVGPIGSYIQMVNVQPWGWNPKGGSLFGHTWIRMVINGKMYHVGGNLSRQILNPDFMATLPMKGKTFTKSSWSPIDEVKKDEHGRTQDIRMLEKIEAIQHYLLTGNFPEACPYTATIHAQFNEVQNHRGGTCTSAASMVFKEVTGVCLYEKGRTETSKTLLNKTVSCILDTLWNIFPSVIFNTVIRPVQAYTRGAKPAHIAEHLG